MSYPQNVGSFSLSPPSARKFLIEYLDKLKPHDENHGGILGVAMALENTQLLAVIVHFAMFRAKTKNCFIQNYVSILRSPLKARASARVVRRGAFKLFELAL